MVNLTHDSSLSQVDLFVEFENYDNNHFYPYVDLDQQSTWHVIRAWSWVEPDIGF
jgi:hypothetical protein